MVGNSAMKATVRVRNSSVPTAMNAMRAKSTISVVVSEVNVNSN